MGCSARIQQIVGKGKRGAAEYIKTCRSAEILDEILDRILSHEISINDSESIDWIRWLMAGGKSPEIFTATVKKYNNASICGYVWTAHSVAYRCRTCSLSPCMSLCAACFTNGNHDGHDYMMFRSQTGGACDCGDSSVMQCSGFCSKHGTSEVSKNLLPPPDLLYIAELMAPRIFCRLILHLRNYRCRSKVTLDADEFLAMLCGLSYMGAAMMRVLTSALTNPEVYRKLTKEWPCDNSSLATYMASSERMYQEALRLSTIPEAPEGFENCPGLRKNLVHRTFLEELVFWTVKYEFPQKLINFLLIMLPDVTYKEALTEAFMLHYSRIGMILETSADPDLLSKRIAKISVQWFSNKRLAVMMTENLCLLEVMIVSLSNMMARISIPADSSSSSSHLVVNCKSSVVSQYRYWCFVSDLNSVFSYRTVAMKFLSNQPLMELWFSFLSYFQGMNVNQRRLTKHVEYEQDTDSVFLAELWAVYPISPLLSHLTDQTSFPLMQNLVRHSLAALTKWLESVTIVEDHVSFHIPLHRSLAIFISHAVNVQQIDLASVLPPDHLIRSILTHPLQIQAAFYEIVNGVWARNGLQIKKQAATYTQNDFCSSMVDADLFLLQLLGTRLLPNEMMMATIKQFKISTWFLLDKSADEDSSAEDQSGKDTFLEGFLYFWATLSANRTNLGNTPLQNIRMELATLSCLADRTHSQLMESLPERCGKSPEFDLILNEISDYNPPNFKYDGNMQQGIYTPKSLVWEELYDPIHVMLRTGMNRKDFQNTLDRYTDYLRKNKLLPATGTPWPPYRITAVSEPHIDPRSMLNGRVFHALVWMILYKYVHQNNVSETVLSLTIYLLELAASVASKNISQPDQEPLESIDVVEQDLENWFRSDCLAENVRLWVRNISCSSCSSSQTAPRVIEANESIVSLLLKCHSKLGGREISIDTDNSNLLALENRIGDGPAFIEKVLIRFVLLSEMCSTMVKNCHENLRTTTLSSESSKTEGAHSEHSEKKRKAEERRKHIMESMARQREKFAKDNQSMLELGEDEMDWQSSETPEIDADCVSSEVYYCGICRKMLTSTKENPIVLLAQVQGTSVLGHRKSSVGTSSAERKRKEMSVVQKEFSDWTYSMTLGVEDGVYVQSCGHVFDYQCLISELKEEVFSCPVCRQNANNVIPILPADFDAQLAESTSVNDSKQAKADISQYLEHVNVTSSSSELFECVVSASLRKIRNCLSPVHQSRYNLSEQSPCNVLFLASVARCNLEMELMLRGGSLIRPSQSNVRLVPKKSCMLPLFRLIGVCARKLNRKTGLKLWKKLIGAETTSRKLTDKRNRKCMPVLLRDPLTMLLHLVLFAVPGLPQEYYLWIVKTLYMLVNFQAAVRLSYQMTEEQRSLLRHNHSDCNLETWCYKCVMGATLELLDTKSIRMFVKESTSLKESCEAFVEMRESSITFLRMASLLKHHLYKEPLPEILSAEEENDCLLDCLKLTHRLEDSDFIKTWFAELKSFLKSGNRSLAAAETLLSGELRESWYQPKLLPLPYEYKDVFQNYQQQSCTVCQQGCEKMSICLVCGTLVCLQGKCCERGGVFEAVRHAVNCGSGTGVYLTVSSSNVIIIRGPKACIWGSIYLDVYGEEDPDLERGKPLYLSSGRYHLLEHAWLSHNFNRIDDAWIEHKDQL